MTQTFNGRALTERHTVRGVEWFGQNPLGLVELRRCRHERFSEYRVFECRLDGAIIGRALRPGAALRRGERWLMRLLKAALRKRSR